MDARKLEIKAKTSGLSDEEMGQLEFETNKKRRNSLESKSSLTNDEINELEGLHKQLKIQEMDYDKTTPVEAVSKNAANELTFGHYPQIAGGVKSLYEERPYVNIRDEEIARLKKLDEEEPTASIAGKGIGIAAQFAIPQLAAAKAFKGLSAGSRMLLGGAEGLANIMGQNPGDTAGVVDPIQPEERFKNVTENPISSSLAIGVPMAGPLAKMARGDVAAEAAYGAIGPKKSIVKDAIRSSEKSPKSIENVGRYALDSGIVTPMSSYEKMYVVASTKADDAGKKISNIIDRNSEALDKYLAANPNAYWLPNPYPERTIGSENIKKVVYEIADELKYDRGGNEAAKQIYKYLKQVIPSGEGAILDAKELQKVRVSLNNSIRWGSKNDELPAIQKAYKLLRSKVDDALNNEIDLAALVLKQNDKASLRKLRDEYTKASIISDTALDKHAASISKKINPTNAAAAGAITGTLLKPTISGAITGAAVGVGGAVANNVMSAGRGASTMASMIDSMQKGGKFPAGISRTAGAMVEQREPEIEGFPVSETYQIGPSEYQAILKQIKSDTSMDSVQRAKRLNLLNKGRVYIGQ